MPRTTFPYRVVVSEESRQLAKDAREHMHWTKGQAAAQAGVYKDAVSDLETGVVHYPTAVIKYAEWLGVPVEIIERPRKWPDREKVSP